MILPHVRLGLRHVSGKRIEKAYRESMRGGGRRKENVIIGMNAAQFTLLWAAALCDQRLKTTVRSNRLNVQRHDQLCCGRSKTGLSIHMPDHGHTNCSPERPKQNFLPMLTS